MIPLYGCAVDSAIIYRLDDPSLDIDAPTLVEQVAAGLWGDVNDDGLVNAADATDIALFTLGLPVTNIAALLQRGDVTGSGGINVLDAQQIARYAAGLSHPGAPKIGTACPGNGIMVLRPTAIEAYIESAALDGGPWTTLRRLAQHVGVAGPCTVKLTPLADGAERTDQAQTITIDPASGSDQMIEGPTDLNGTTFAYRLDLLAYSKGLTLGSTALHIIPRRSQRS